MKYTIKPSTKFKKGVKAAEKSGKDMKKLSDVVKMLAEGIKLPPEYVDHPLSGNLAGKRECHIEPNGLLIYEYKDNDLVLYLVDLGSHSNLYKK